MFKEILNIYNAYYHYNKYFLIPSNKIVFVLKSIKYNLSKVEQYLTNKKSIPRHWNSLNKINVHCYLAAIPHNNSLRLSTIIRWYEVSQLFY